MLMRCTVSVGRMGGKAVNSCTAVHRNRIHPTPVPVWAGEGDAQPTKWVTSSLVVTLKRGAPAPQCEPLGSPNKSGFRRSYPSSVRLMPLTPRNVAPAEALLFVGPVFTSNRPKFRLSRGSPG